MNECAARSVVACTLYMNWQEYTCWEMFIYTSRLMYTSRHPQSVHSVTNSEQVCTHTKGCIYTQARVQHAPDRLACLQLHPDKFLDLRGGHGRHLQTEQVRS